jgi:hypothetical protein
MASVHIAPLSPEPDEVNRGGLPVEVESVEVESGRSESMSPFVVSSRTSGFGEKQAAKGTVKNSTRNVVLSVFFRAGNLE